MTKRFVDKLSAASQRNNSILCLGLDPDPIKFPLHFPGIDDDPQTTLVSWAQKLIEQTGDLVCCYKPNFAFYEQYGPPGLAALRQIIAAVPDDIPVLLDAKRGDIGSTATAYARAAFEVWGADAVTVNPYLGQDSIEPYLAYPGKMIFVLCYTSNPSAREFQAFTSQNNDQLFEHVARQAQTWGQPDQVAFVVGATQPQALAHFRALAPDRWVLAPGVGAQGGTVEEVLSAGLTQTGQGLIISASRSISYADDPRGAALALRSEIVETRSVVGGVMGQVSGVTHKDDTVGVENSKAELIFQLHETGCIQFGDFTLASGQSSPIYIDLRRISSSPDLLKLAAQAYTNLLAGLSFDCLAAVPYAALTIGTAVALTVDKPLIYPRKEVKSYGTGRAVEGIYASGDKVVIIEDLVTTGGSILTAVEPLTAAGLEVKDVVVLIDREQGGARCLAEAGYRLHAALPLSEVLDMLRRAGRVSEEAFERVKRYLVAVRK